MPKVHDYYWDLRNLLQLIGDKIRYRCFSPPYVRYVSERFLSLCSIDNCVDIFIGPLFGVYLDDLVEKKRILCCTRSQIDSFSDLRVLIPYIKEAVDTKCYARVSIEYSAPDMVTLCSFGNSCVRIYRSFGGVYVEDGRSGEKTRIGGLSLNKSIELIATLLCRY